MPDTRPERGGGQRRRRRAKRGRRRYPRTPSELIAYIVVSRERTINALLLLGGLVVANADRSLLMPVAGLASLAVAIKAVTAWVGHRKAGGGSAEVDGSNRSRAAKHAVEAGGDPARISKDG